MLTRAEKKYQNHSSPTVTSPAAQRSLALTPERDKSPEAHSLTHPQPVTQGGHRFGDYAILPPFATQAVATQPLQAKSVEEKQEPDQDGTEAAPENKTGMPDRLKSGIENLSGLSMDDVKVHYNSPQPANVQAHAYAQGTDIHIGPGQEKHLPHEAWHVVQQKQGRVQSTLQMQGVSINDDQGLEKEADAMGGKSLNTVLQRQVNPFAQSPRFVHRSGQTRIIQRAGHADAFKKISGDRFAKKTNEAEAALYAEPGALDGVIPRAADQERTEEDETKIESMNVGEGEAVAIMENLFSGIDEDARLVFDIKIGKSTASRTQLLASQEKGKAGAFFKKLKMKISDSITKSSERGWRVIPQGDESRASVGRNSETYIANKLSEKIQNNRNECLASIRHQLQGIKDSVTAEHITFIAASVLIVIDTQNPAAANAKLIDLAHPLRIEDEGFAKYNQRFHDGLDSLMAFLESQQQAGLLVEV